MVAVAFVRVERPAVSYSRWDSGSGRLRYVHRTVIDFHCPRHSCRIPILSFRFLLTDMTDLTDGTVLYHVFTLTRI